MPRILVTWAEIGEALNALEVTDVGGEKCVDGVALVAAIEELVPFQRTGITRRERHAMNEHVATHERLAREGGAVSTPPSPEIVNATPSPVAALELERRRLAALPPGDCAMCHHLEHEGGRCVECDCDNYVDATNRDPVVSLQQQGADVNPDVDTSAIPPAVTVGEADPNVSGLFTRGTVMGPEGHRVPLVGGGHDGFPVQ